MPRFCCERSCTACSSCGGLSDTCSNMIALGNAMNPGICGMMTECSRVFLFLFSMCECFLHILALAYDRTLHTIARFHTCQYWWCHSLSLLTSVCLDTVLQTKRDSAPTRAAAAVATNVAKLAAKHAHRVALLAAGLARASRAANHARRTVAIVAAVDPCPICCAQFLARRAIQLHGPFRTRNKGIPRCTTPLW